MSDGLKNTTAITVNGSAAFSVGQTYLIQISLIVAAVGLPALAHLMGAPVRWLLPMHWPVLAAGLLLGGKSGLLTGALSPASNWLVTGYPLPAVLPAMTVELAAYGFIAGLLHRQGNGNPFFALPIALIAGRFAFLVVILITSELDNGLKHYLSVAMLPGLFAAGLQVLVLGLVARFIFNRSS